MTAFSKTHPDQRVYLAKVTTTFYVDDGVFESAVADPTTDEATTTPGYLVNFPDSYDQSFDVPALDLNGETLIITFKYELLIASEDAKSGYTKQTLTDTVLAELSF